MLSNIYFLINFAISIFLSMMILCVVILMLYTVIKHRYLHTLNNLMLSNTNVGILCYCLVNVISCVLGLNESWSQSVGGCSIRGYLLNVCFSSIGYSKSVHSMSRLFFCVFNSHRYLLTVRMHCLLITLSWLISFVICLVPFLFVNGYRYEDESRFCVLSTKQPGLAYYMLVVGGLVPFIIFIQNYLIIYFKVRRSTRRIWAITANRNVNQVQSQQKRKREIKIMRQMLIQLLSLTPGIPILMFLVLWHWQRPEQSPPNELYLFNVNAVTLSIVCITLTQLITNDKIQRQIFRSNSIQI